MEIQKVKKTLRQQQLRKMLMGMEETMKMMKPGNKKVSSRLVLVQMEFL